MTLYFKEITEKRSVKNVFMVFEEFLCKMFTYTRLEKKSKAKDIK